MPAIGGDLEPGGEDHQLSQDERAELERLRAETARLRRAAAGHRGWRGRWRALVSIVLIVVGCVIAPIAVLGAWAGTQVSDTGRWVATVEPLIHDPAIQNVLTDKITNEITAQLNLTGNINQASAELTDRGLPRIARLLKTFGPQIATAVTGFIRSVVHSVISSKAMASAWAQANTVAHQGLVKVLSGRGNGAIGRSDGQVVLNLAPFIDVAKQALVDRGFSLAGSIPQVNPTVALFDAKYLDKAQAGYRLITTLKIVLPIVALLFLAAGVFAARGRRRALIGAGLGLAASMLVLGAALLVFRAVYLDSVPGDVLPGGAAAAAFDAFASFIRLSLRAVLVAGLVVAIGAFFTGPAHAAVQTRSALNSGLARLRRFGELKGVSTGPVGRWTYARRRGLRVGAVALAALIFVFWGQPTALVVIVIAVLLLVSLGAIELIGSPGAERETASQA